MLATLDSRNFWEADYPQTGGFINHDEKMRWICVVPLCHYFIQLFSCQRCVGD
jgi:hypothetical protein